MEFKDISQLGGRSIQPLWNTMPSIKDQPKTETAPEGSFADVFRWAIDNVKETDAEMNKAQYLLATGQLDNPAEVTIANTKAAAAVDLLVQLRNKAVEAYNEIMRISL